MELFIADDGTAWKKMDEKAKQEIKYQKQLEE